MTPVKNSFCQLEPSSHLCPPNSLTASQFEFIALDTQPTHLKRDCHKGLIEMVILLQFAHLLLYSVSDK